VPRLDLLNSPRSLCLCRCADRLFNQNPVLVSQRTPSTSELPAFVRIAFSDLIVQRHPAVFVPATRRYPPDIARDRPSGLCARATGYRASHPGVSAPPR
jgi:hypothetical protein